jgi:hypothetical protein
MGKAAYTVQMSPRCHVGDRELMRIDVYREAHVDPGMDMLVRILQRKDTAFLRDCERMRISVEMWRGSCVQLGVHLAIFREMNPGGDMHVSVGPMEANTIGSNTTQLT